MQRFIAVLGCVWLVLTGCGDDDSGGSGQVARACDVSCAKLVECDAIGGLSKSECVQTCTTKATSGGASCTVSEAKANACIDAYAATTCEELLSGDFPAACADLCPNQTQNDATGSDATADAQDAVPANGGCDALATCCAQIADADAKQGCQGLAASGNQQLCGQTLTGYRAANLCD